MDLGIEFHIAGEL